MVFNRSIVVTFTNIIARAAHLLLFLSIGNSYGVGPVSDAVFFLYAPLGVIISVAAGVADVVVMPTMHRAFEAGCADAVQRAFTRKAFIVVFLIGLCALLIGWLIVPDASLSAVITMIPIPMLAALSAINVGLLNAEGKFNSAALGPAYGAVLAVPMLFLLPLSQTSLAAILLLYEIGRMCGLRLHLSRQRSHESADLSLVTSLLANAFRSAKWQIAGSFLMASNLLVDIMFASYLGAGSISYIEYASRLWNLIPLFFAGYLTIAYSNMSRSAAVGDLVVHNIHIMALRLGFLAVISSVLIISFRISIIELIYSFGAISISEKLILANLMSMYLVGSGFYIAGMVYVRGYSAAGRVNVLTWIAMVNVIFNLVFNAVFIRFIGIYGIGLATSMSYGISLILFVYNFGGANRQSNLVSKA